MAFLTRDQILNANDLDRELVHVPEWGGKLYVRAMTGAERDKFEASVISTNKRGQTESNFANLRARLVALCAVDEDGEALFRPTDIAALGRKSARALQRVYDAAQRLNGMSSDDMEELAGNSEATGADDSNSDLPSRSVAPDENSSPA